MNINWSALGFHYTEPDYIVRAACHDGVWEQPYATKDKYLHLHVSATCIQYGQEAFEGLKELASGYEKIHAKDKAVEVYKRYLDLVKDPVEYKLAKSKLEKLENFGTGDAEESVGLIDKIVGFFNKG